VNWWSTLHQPASISRLGAPAIHISMLIPLLVMALAFTVYYLAAVLVRARCELLESEAGSQWARSLLTTGEPGK